MKSTLVTLAACICLLVVTAWTLVTPVYAATASAVCKNGTVVSCSGSFCESRDSTQSEAGYCSCTGPNGTFDYQKCNDTPILW